MLLMIGSSGSFVEQLQSALNERGASLVVDGEFGPKTEAAVRGFQADTGLVVDGLCGPATWTAVHRPIGAVEGLDVSGWQGDLDWEDVYDSGRRFVWVKATEGISHVSPGLKRHWEPAGDAGLARGGYHFARLDFEGVENPEGQAEHFVEQLPPGLVELPPLLDLELGGIPRHLPKITVVAWGLMWLERVRSLIGVDPMIYLGYWTWAWLDRTRAFFPFRLLLADHGTPDPIPGWDATVVQYTGRGRIPGYDGLVDLDVSLVPLEELKA